MERLEKKIKVTANQKYDLLRHIMISNRSHRLSRSDIMVRYMEVINKTQTEQELDDVLTAIFINEQSRKQTGKNNW